MNRIKLDDLSDNGLKGFCRRIITARLGAFAIAVLTLTAAAGHLSAGNLYVPNASFESQQTFFADPRIDFWQKSAQPAGFDTNVFGAWDNLAGVFINSPLAGADYITNGVGNQMAFLFSYPGMEIFQNYDSTDWSGTAPSHAFKATFLAGRSYRLSVGLTTSMEEPLTPGATLLLSLYYRDAASNQVTVASTTVTYATNVFTNLNQLLEFSVALPAVSASNACVGKHIGIQIQSTVSPALIGGVWDLENVRLTETIVIPNGSFESQPTSFADPRVDAWQKPPQPPTFDTNVFGAWDNLAGVFINSPLAGPGFIVNGEGNQMAYLFAYPQLALFQDANSQDWTGSPPTHAFTQTYQPGKAYSLTVGLTSSSQEPLTPGSTLEASLYYRDDANHPVTIASTTATYDTNTFADLTHLVDFTVTVPNVKPTDPWAGKTIGIQFQSTASPFLIGGVWDLDNVRLVEYTAVEITNPAQVNGQFNLTIQSEPGQTFELLSTAVLGKQSSTWTSLGQITSESGNVRFTDTNSPTAQRFYRARQLP